MNLTLNTKEILEQMKIITQKLFKKVLRGRRHLPLAVAVYDGKSWSMTVLTFYNGKWQADTPVECDSRNGRQIPRSLLDAAAKAGVSRLRLLLSDDPRIFSIEAHHELFPEELQSALCFEARGEIGPDAEDMRFSSTPASRYEMGAGNQELLTAGFKLESLKRFAADARRAGLDFESAGALESFILKWHSKRSPETRLLFVREHTSFYVVPSFDAQPFMVTTLPLGLDALHNPVAKERAQRARERLSAHKTLPLSVIIAGHEPRKDHSEIKLFLGETKNIKITALPDLIREITVYAASTRENGEDSSCGLACLPPKPRDPHQHGTVIFFIILFMTLGWIGLQRHTYIREIKRSQRQLESWEKLQAARKTSKTSSERLRSQLDAQRVRLRLLSDHNPLPKGLLTILGAVSRHMPEYSRLESIRQIEGGFEIIGVTRWQEGLSQLDSGLRQAAASQGLQREFKGLETMQDSGLQRFRFVVRPREGSR